jgi:hypothetical protein
MRSLFFPPLALVLLFSEPQPFCFSFAIES